MTNGIDMSLLPGFGGGSLGSMLPTAGFIPTFNDPQIYFGTGGIDELLSGPSSTPQGWLAPLIGLGSQIVSALQMPPTRLPPMTGPSSVPGPFGLPIPVAEVGQIEAGTSVSASAFRGVCKPARRRFKIQYDATGTPHVISVCPPRRMNPLNPKALGRAARRLGSFQRIASHVEKTIQRSLRKTGGKARRSPAHYHRGCK